MSELKPCPFCGGNNLDEAYGDNLDYADYWIECRDCEFIVSKDTKAQTVTLWNTRDTQQFVERACAAGIKNKSTDNERMWAEKYDYRRGYLQAINDYEQALRKEFE